MNDIDKRDGIQEIIDNALGEMGFDRRNGDFRPKSVNLAEFCRETGLSRSKARTLQKKAFVAVHGNCGKKREATVIAGFEEEHTCRQARPQATNKLADKPTPPACSGATSWRLRRSQSPMQSAHR